MSGDLDWPLNASRGFVSRRLCGIWPTKFVESETRKEGEKKKSLNPPYSGARVNTSDKSRSCEQKNLPIYLGQFCRPTLSADKN